jgi:hypothetical protein
VSIRAACRLHCHRTNLTRSLVKPADLKNANATGECCCLPPQTQRVKANDSSPSCSQCQTASTACHYQEGGKRGLPAAYIKALEERLAATETALFASLMAIRSQAAEDLIANHLPSTMFDTPSRQRSKAERLADWRRLPLQTRDQLMVWLRAQEDENLAAAAAPQIDDSRSIPDNQVRTAVPSKTILELLATCSEPTVPNSLGCSPGSRQWTENYF